MYRKISVIIMIIWLFALNAAYGQMQSSAPISPAASTTQSSPSQAAIPQATPSSSGQSATVTNVQQSSGVNNMSPAQQQSVINNLNNLSPAQQQAILNTMSPAQQQAFQAELNKAGGVLNQQVIDALKKSPDFKNLSPEEIAKGKELLEKNNKPEEKKEIKEVKEIKDLFEDKKAAGEENASSLFERSRRIGKYQDIPLGLKPFGYDFFNGSAITDRKDVPVPAKYIVGPGDEVKILLWGRVNAQYNLVIDRNGSITIPQVGPLYVTGMTFEQMSTYLIKQTTQIIGANIDVTMGALKTIPIFILGDVKKPGSYMVGSFATITDALLLAGGPNEIGSMRNIQLRRKDKVITRFDLYNLLLKGEKYADFMLQAGDVIFIPVAGPLVGVAGNVKRPAIYELKDKLDLDHLFDLAGGIIPTAYTQQIQVERVIKNEKQIVVDINNKKLDRAKTFLLQDADLVKVFSIVDASSNIVNLNGHVKRPGVYEIKPGMKLKDIIKGVDDLLPEPYFEYALIKRITMPSGEAVLIPFKLGKLIFDSDPEANLTLMPQDNIYIFSALMFKDKPYFTIEGEIRKPAKHELIKQFKVKDAILVGGGLTKDAYLEKAEILRRDKTRQYRTIYFNVAGAMAENGNDNILLQDEDRIIIHSNAEHYYKTTVSIEGDVLKPGDFQFTERMTVRDLVFAAGNVLESAYLDDAEISSMKIERGAASKLIQRNINLRKALAGDVENNLRLQPYDRVFVKRITDWRRENYITITGQVKFPGKYILTKGEKLSSVIQRAGGFTEYAHLRGAVFTREKVKERQKKSLDEITERLEKELLIGGANSLSAAVSTEEIQGKKIELEQKKQFIENMKNVKVQGRMTIKLAHLRLLKGSEYDIELDDGDTLSIPEKNSAIIVTGAVMGQGSYIFSEKADYLDYINMSGGFSNYADTGNVFILKVDGSARKAHRGVINWNEKQERMELAAFSEDRAVYIEPGDVIVVPEKIERIAWLREIRDITQILMNTAVAAGVVIKLF